MNRHNRFILCMFLLLVCAMRAVAQGSPRADEALGSAPLFEGPSSLESLVAHALANNPRIQAARYHARALAARVPQARSLPDPQLGATVFLEEIQTAAGPQQAALSLSQKFPWFGKRAFQSQAAYHDATAAYARATAAELEVIEQVKRAYLDLAFFQAAIAETRRLRPRLEDVIAIARTRYETSAAGAGLDSVLQAQVELAKLKTRLVELEEAAAGARARLAAAAHLPAGTRVEATGKPAHPDLAHQVEVLVGLAEANQPELEARRREVARDRAAIRVAERQYWPDVNLGVNWYEMGSSGLSPVANGRDAFSLGVGVNLPIYRGRLDAAVREARARTAADNRRYAAERDRLQGEVGAFYARFREHDRALAIISTEILPAAEQTLELAIESYRTSQAGYQQLIDVYRTLLDHRIEQHRRAAARAQAVASLERAVGCSITAPREPKDAGQ
jgi:outer membrane protein TolC